MRFNSLGARRMRGGMVLFGAGLVLAVGLSLPVFAADATPQPLAFVRTYCVECHGPEAQKAERRFDQLALPADSTDALVDLQDMIDQLTLGDMPPSDARNVRPQFAHSRKPWLPAGPGCEPPAAKPFCDDSTVASTSTPSAICSR